MERVLCAESARNDVDNQSVLVWFYCSRNNEEYRTTEGCWLVNAHRHWQRRLPPIALFLRHVFTIAKAKARKGHPNRVVALDSAATLMRGSTQKWSA